METAAEKPEGLPPLSACHVNNVILLTVDDRDLYRCLIWKRQL